MHYVKGFPIGSTELSTTDCNYFCKEFPAKLLSLPYKASSYQTIEGVNYCNWNFSSKGLTSGFRFLNRWKSDRRKNASGE